jgi:hypothetical protein
VAVFFLWFAPQSFAVNNFLFDATSKNLQMGETLEVPVNIHTDSGTEVIGADIWMTIDESYLDVQSINQGSYFPTVTGQKTSTGKIYIAGILEDTTTTKTGDGTIATVLFTPKKTGTTEIKFDCRGNDVSDTSKININFTNPQNVIDCSSTAANILTINVGAASNGATPTPEGGVGGATPTPANYVPGNTTLTPTPSGLPNSGFFDNTLYYIISGGALMSIGGIIRKLYARPF